MAAFNMNMDRKRLLSTCLQVASFIVTRYPFWHALVLIMNFAERSKSKKYPDLEIPWVYADLGAYVLLASFTSFNIKRRWFAIACAVQLAISLTLSLTSQHAPYSEWLSIRISSKSLAVIGSYLTIGSGIGELYRRKARDRSTQQISLMFTGLHLVCQAYTLFYSREDKQAFLEHVFGGQPMLSIFTFLHVALGLAFLSGYEPKLLSRAMMVVLFITATFLDTNINYWTRGRHVEFWVQVRLLTDNLCIFAGLSMMAIDG
ncbi:TMEM101 [Branchiostoma lanceolatum]|uniref:TMEM101 protein n=1 Tax=Branchiostoma lanceolatum TaxID=7740 RepID=A0A8K0E6I9_BRALA|nr:TMEM101 [Branchiostoma lanceolatum]